MLKNNEETKGWQIALFALNGISSNTALAMIGYYMFFSQNILGLSAVIVGMIATIMRVFDGVTDPIIGVLIDKTNTKFGKFRPYMILGCIIVIISLIAIFNAPKNLSIKGSYIYTTIFYTVYIIGYTFQTTCTRAAQAVLTKDPKQRPLFGVFNSGFNAILNAIFPLILMTWMAPNYNNQLQNPKLWSDMSLIVAGMMCVFSLLACIGISKKDNPKFYNAVTKYQKVGFHDMWNVICKNKPLRMLIIAASTDKLALTLMNGVTVYIFSNLILNNSLQGTYASIRVLPVLFISMGGISLARKFGLKKPFLGATWISTVCLIVMFFLGAKPNNYKIFLFIFIIQSCMTGITNNILNPMIADCADYEEYRSGKFVPGIVGTVFTFVDKITSSVATTIVGISLAFAGVGKGQIPTNEYVSEKFYWLMMICFCIIPILGHIATIISMKYYTLTREKMVEIQKELEERKLNKSYRKSQELNNIDIELEKEKSQEAQII